MADNVGSATPPPDAEFVPLDAIEVIAEEETN